MSKSEDLNLSFVELSNKAEQSICNLLKSLQKVLSYIVMCYKASTEEGWRESEMQTEFLKKTCVCVCFTLKIKRACHIDSESNNTTSFAIQALWNAIAIWLFLLWLCARFMTFSIVYVYVCAKNSIIKYQHTHTSTAH